MHFTQKCTADTETGISHSAQQLGFEQDDRCIVFRFPVGTNVFFFF